MAQIQKLERSDNKHAQNSVICGHFSRCTAIPNTKKKIVIINKKYPRHEKIQKHTESSTNAQNAKPGKSRLRKFENSSISLWFCRFASAKETISLRFAQKGEIRRKKGKGKKVKGGSVSSLEQLPPLPSIRKRTSTKRELTCGGRQFAIVKLQKTNRLADARKGKGKGGKM